MVDGVRLKEQYVLAKCCRPTPGQTIVGYFSQDRVTLKVHAEGCYSLEKVAADRLLTLQWEEIVAPAQLTPGGDYHLVTELDWQILTHHRRCGVDYSLMVAHVLHADRKAVFDGHRRMRKMGLLKRVEPLMIQYRKGIVDNKWIKHRNHTYYELTPKGNLYLDFRERGAQR